MGVVRLSHYLYTRFGIFVHPVDLARSVLMPSALISKSATTEKILELANDSVKRAMWSVRAAFYALGAPVTRFLVVRRGGRGEWYEMPYIMQTSIRQFIDLDFLREEASDPVTGKRLSVLPHLIHGFEKALDRYEVAVGELVPRDDITADNPALYRGLLYLYSDQDLVKGDYQSYNRGKSLHTDILEKIRLTAGEVQYLKDIAIPFESAEALEAVKKGDTEKYKEYVDRVDKTGDMLCRLRDEVADLATPYNPKYIEFLGYASESVYSRILGDIEKNIKHYSGGGDDAKLKELKTVAELANEIRRLLEALEEMQSYDAYLKHLERERKKKLAQDDWSILETFKQFFELLEKEGSGSVPPPPPPPPGGGDGAAVAAAPAQTQAQQQRQEEGQQTGQQRTY